MNQMQVAERGCVGTIVEARDAGQEPRAADGAHIEHAQTE